MTGNVLTVGSLMMDVIAYVSRNPRLGETMRGDDLEIVPGGKGFNQAIAAQRAGVHSTLVGCMGRDAFGDEFAKFLAKEQVDASGVARSDLVGTGVGLPIVSKDGQNAIIITVRANDLVDAAFIAGQRERFAGQDMLLLQRVLEAARGRFLAGGVSFGDAAGATALVWRRRRLDHLRGW